MKTEINKMILCVAITTILALSAHIFMMKVCFNLNALFNPTIPLPNPQYNGFIMTMAYLTAIFPTTVVAIIYYFGGQVLPSPKKYVNAIILTLLVLGIKGELLRMPLMDFICNMQFGLKEALISSFFKHLHVWIANFILSICIVFLCPKKSRNLTENTCV